MKIRLFAGTLLVLSATVASTAVAADLAGLATVADRTSHRASSFDPTGGNEDDIVSFEPGKTVVMLDTDGPGVINHLWFTVSSFLGGVRMPLRDLVLRIYWEGSKTPSVEVPLGDFFGMGHGRTYPVQSLPINVGANLMAMNCYWPMPFYKHARFEIANTGKASIRRFFYHIDYELGPIPANQGLFHAEFRSVRNLKPQSIENNTDGRDNYVILNAEGEGHYVGCFLFVDSAKGGWWGEGDDMIFIDGAKKPTIQGTGTEDYFNEAWGFRNVTGFPFYGVPLLDKLPDGWTQTACYRLHVPDPVRFKKSIRVTIEHTWPKNVGNDYSSVAYWYQTQPAAKRQPLPQGENYLPRSHAKADKPLTSLQWPAVQGEADLRTAGVAARAMTLKKVESKCCGYLRIAAPNRDVALPLPSFAPGEYRVELQLFNIGSQKPVTLQLNGNAAKQVEPIAGNRAAVSLGTARVGKDGTLTVKCRSAEPFGVECVVVKPVK
jgi:hypothetical protein